MDSTTKVIRVDTAGTIQLVHDDEFVDGIEGSKTKQRASHVEPVQPVLRLCFHLLRWLVKDDSELAAWTRRWRCRWRARIFYTPKGKAMRDGGPFLKRSEAIRWEVSVLQDHLKH